MLDLTVALSLIPYLLAAAYALKLTLTRETYPDGKSLAGDMVIAALATAYTLFLIFAAGPDKLLLSCILYAPGAISVRHSPPGTQPSAVPPSGGRAVRDHCAGSDRRRGCPGDRRHRDLTERIDMTNSVRRLRRALRGRQAAQGAGVLAGSGARTAHPDQLRRPVVRRRAVGAERAPRPLRLHGQDARPRRRGRRTARRC